MDRTSGPIQHAAAVISLPVQHREATTACPTSNVIHVEVLLMQVAVILIHDPNRPVVCTQNENIESPATIPSSQALALSLLPLEPAICVIDDHSGVFFPEVVRVTE